MPNKKNTINSNNSIIGFTSQPYTTTQLFSLPT